MTEGRAPARPQCASREARRVEIHEGNCRGDEIGHRPTHRPEIEISRAKMLFAALGADDGPTHVRRGSTMRILAAILHAGAVGGAAQDMGGGRRLGCMAGASCGGIASVSIARPPIRGRSTPSGRCRRRQRGAPISMAAPSRPATNFQGALTR